MPSVKTTTSGREHPDREQDERDQYGFIDKVRLSVACLHSDPIYDFENYGRKNGSDELSRDKFSPLEVPGPQGSAHVWTEHTNEYSHLVMEFCPAKYLWGSNLYGPADMMSIVTTIVPDIMGRLNLSLSWEEEELLHTGASRLYRADSAAMQDLARDEAVNGHLTLVGTGSHKLRRKTIEPGSVIFGKSDYYKVTTYNKHLELTRKPKSWGENYAGDTRELVLHSAKGKVRTEVQTGSKKLRDHKLDTVAAWDPLTPGRIVRANQRLIRVNEYQSLPPRILDGLKTSTRAIYWMWFNGDDPKNHYSPSGLKPHRDALMVAGVDITVPRNICLDEKSPQKMNLPFSHVIEFPYVQPPQTLIERELYCELNKAPMY